MASFDEIKTYINENDAFCRSNSMCVTDVAEGFARAELTVTPAVLNAHGVVQGGAIFTLADMAFAAAGNSFPGSKCTSMTSTISYLRPGTGAKLTAVARTVNRGKRSCLIEIEVRDENDKLAAKVATIGFFIQ